MKKYTDILMSENKFEREILLARRFLDEVEAFCKKDLVKEVGQLTMQLSKQGDLLRDMEKLHTARYDDLEAKHTELASRYVSVLSDFDKLKVKFEKDS